MNTQAWKLPPALLTISELVYQLLHLLLILARSQAGVTVSVSLMPTLEERIRGITQAWWFSQSAALLDSQHGWGGCLCRGHFSLFSLPLHRDRYRPPDLQVTMLLFPPRAWWGPPSLYLILQHTCSLTRHYVSWSSDISNPAADTRYL